MRTYRTLRRLRPLVQAGALLLFLYLLLATRRDLSPFLPVQLFFRLDPLVGLASMIAARTWIGLLALSLLVLVATLVLGRAWCGWLCPLGTVLDLFPLNRKGKRADSSPATRWRQVKHFILLALLFGALLGGLGLIFLDPITLLTRTLAVGLLPALNIGIGALEKLLYSVPLLQAPVEWFEVQIRAPWLPAAQSFYWPNLVLIVVLVGVIVLNRVAERFWCRYLCPLGSLLGLVSKVALVRRTVGATCSGCQRCARSCPTGTIDPARGFASDPAECTVCLDCVVACPKDDVRFTVHTQPAAWQQYDPSRRQALASLAVGAGGVVLFRVVPRGWQVTDTLIRPPGAQQGQFWAMCIRCGECMRVCPTSGLQPALWQAGPEGLWTPVLVPRIGYCDYSCYSCGQACPTGAIPPLTLEEKRLVVIGVAAVNRDRCLPWAQATPCIICEEMCPVPEKAIELEEAEVTDAAGQPLIVQRPHVVAEQCIGCGICEFKCPVDGPAAIRVMRPEV
jgi:MauM/NapG family ferredoxin protein